MKYEDHIWPQLNKSNNKGCWEESTYDPSCRDETTKPKQKGPDLHCTGWREGSGQGPSCRVQKMRWCAHPSTAPQGPPEHSASPGPMSSHHQGTATHMQGKTKLIHNTQVSAVKSTFQDYPIIMGKRSHGEKVLFSILTPACIRVG